MKYPDEKHSNGISHMGQLKKKKKKNIYIYIAFALES